ncbi:hypothetical protein MATL_G00072990 [Megalops atlanticus]|uniref:Phorbol-ester/DAG-type domain-containing protein n=1 Tax=Megalops atlanticus TaxID=7932 RepID=A0A9D3TC49_MEGAT|nr:hypothetical protein MATL_G00072990 [Megalops atlanticus]
MASLTLGQHTSQHHLDDQQLFLKKLTANERKKFLRKSSSEMKSRRSAAAAESMVGKVGTAVSGPLASLNHSHLPEHRGSPENGVGVSYVVDLGQQPRCTVGVVADSTCPGKSSKCGDLRAILTVAADTSQTLQNKSRKDGENGKLKKVKRSPDRSCGATSCTQVCSPVASGQGNLLKDSKAFKSNGSPTGHANLHRSGGKRASQITVHQHLDFRSLGDENGYGEWLVGERVPILTQGRSGVVKMMRSDPPRREVWSIFTQDPRVKPEKGEGHLFTSRSATQDWCDACNRQVNGEARKCKNCSYTCHLECERLVQLDCNQRDKQSEDTSSPRTPAPTPQEKAAQREGTQGPGRSSSGLPELICLCRGCTAEPSRVTPDAHNRPAHPAPGGLRPPPSFHSSAGTDQWCCAAL